MIVADMTIMATRNLEIDGHEFCNGNQESGGPPMRSSGPINSDQFSPRLLVVEDNPLNQRLAERMLVKMNYCVDIVSDGRQAVAAVERGNYLAILMDCQMPVMDGFEAARAIRALPGFSGQTAIIAMTALDTADARQQCLDAGMNAFASKPVDWKRIAALLHRTVMGGPAELKRVELEANSPHAWREHVVLNLDVLAQVIGEQDGPGVIIELVQLFRSETDQLFDRLGITLAAGNIQASQVVCTDLRGTVSSVGAERLAKLMADVGEMIRNGRINDAIQCADQIWDELGLVLGALEDSVAAASRAASVPAG